MTSLHARRLALASVLLLAISACTQQGGVQLSPPSVRLENFRLVSERVLAPTVTESTYRATCRADAGPFDDAVAFVSAPDLPVAFVDATLRCGQLGKGGFRPTLDTIVLQRDPSRPFDPNTLGWITLAWGPTTLVATETEASGARRLRYEVEFTNGTGKLESVAAGLSSDAVTATVLDGLVTASAQRNAAVRTGDAFEVRVAAGATLDPASLIWTLSVGARSEFALGVARTLDGLGQPLGDVAVEERGPAGLVLRASEPISGIATLAEQAGSFQWRFEKDGYLPVWREGTLAAGQVLLVPSPWLARRSDERVTLSVLNGGAVGDGDPATVQFAGGAFAAASDATLSALDGQSLPGPLPPGWSPLAAFWLELSVEPTQPGNAELRLDDRLAPGERAFLARFDEASLRWIETGTPVAASGDVATTSLAASGAYAVVVPDAGAAAPPAPIAGQPLRPSATPFPLPDGLAALGTVVPPVAPASLDPVAITAQAEVVVSHAGLLPSGFVLRGDVDERYDLRDGTSRTAPSYETFFTAYQRPGDDDPHTLHARFALRPQVAVAPEALDEARVQVEVLPLSAFEGGFFDESGGRVGAPGVLVSAGPGVVSSARAVEVRSLDPSRFADLAPAGSLLMGFEFAADGLLPGARLALGFGPQEPDAHFVVARFVQSGSRSGLEPRERFASDGGGVLRSVEPKTGERLPGVTGSGQYVLVRVGEAQALVQGVARNSAGQPAGGLAVEISGAPWLTFSAPDGRWKLVAAPGNAEVVVTNLLGGDRGVAQVALADASSVGNADVATQPSGPRVTSTNPDDGATGVRASAPIRVLFSERLASLAPGDLVLTDASGDEVPATLTTDLGLTEATLLPIDPLASGVAFTLTLAATIADPSGLPIEGPLSFTFSTQSVAARGAGAQLISWEPGAQTSECDGVPGFDASDDTISCVVGGIGTADPNAAVVLVNETRGTTATVLSGPDGSFKNFIDADVDDFIAATFVNGNGTRIRIPLSRQLFDDGSVALFQGGGILEAESDGGPVQVLIEPGTIKNKNKFKIEPLDQLALLELIQSNPPEDAQLLAGAMRFTVEGEAPDGEANLSFPADPATLDLPDGVPPERGAYAAAIVRDQADGSKVYEVVDKLRFEDGKIASNTLPFLGLLFLGAALDGGDIFSAIVVPMLLGADPATVTGRVLECPGQQCLGLASISALQVGRPLAGALVSLHAPSARASQKGLLDPGMVYATSGPDGRYALVAPSLASGYVLTASHPKHARPVSEPVIGIFDFSISGAIEKNLIFSAPFPGSINGPVRVNAAHEPSYPAPGQPAHLLVSAAHGAGAPTVSIELSHVEPLVEGVEVTNADVTIGAETTLEPLSPTRKQVGVDISATPGKSLVAYLRIRASVSSTDPSVSVPPKTILHPIAFGVGPAQAPNGVTPSDDNDGVGPVVINTIPADGAVAVSAGEPIALVFNEPIDASVETTPGAVSIVGEDGASVPFTLELSDSQRILLVRPGPFSSDTDYTLTASTLIRDVRSNGAGTELDQDPATPGPQGFTLQFHTAAAPVTALPGIDSGGGAVLGRSVYAFAIARTPAPALVVYDLSIPTAPVEVNRIGLPGFPRDLVFIPQYSFKTRAEAPTRTHDLLVVVGGDLGSQSLDDDGNFFTPPQYASVFDVQDPVNPERVGFANLTRRIGTVTRVEWRPPLLVYLESGADAQFVSSALLQELILGANLSNEERADLPLFGVREIDGNGDGDFVDEATDEHPADRLPLPNPSVDYFGKRGSCLVDETNQRILDFEFDGAFCAVTLSDGNVRTLGGSLGPPVPPQYRTVQSEGQPIDRLQGSVDFGAGARPKRLAVLFNTPLELPGGVETRNLALVSLSPDADGVAALAVIDVTLPAAPALLVKIPFADTLGLGLLQSVSERTDGLLGLATTTSVVLLDPRKLALPAPTEPGALHPAVSGVIREAGSGAMSLDGNAAGLNVVSLGARNQVVLSPPRLRFVAFNGEEPPVDPTELVDDPAQIETEFARMRSIASLAPARLGAQGGATPTLDPASRTVHYHVLLDLPGGAGDEVEILLESLNRAGRSLSNRGRDFAPVRAAADTTLEKLGQEPREDCDADIRRFVAKRLSSDKKSPDYNRYLSLPFALTYERLPSERLDTLRDDPKREILWSGHFVRASIDPDESVDPVLAPFISLVDGFEKTIRPGTSVTARSLEALYVMGPNPPPPSGAIDAPGSLGMVNAANGEIRMQNVDLVMPSRRMPIVFQRSIGGQDLNEGVFGRGWDFNYAQRLVPLDGEVFPDGQVMPLVERSTEADSNRARSRDVLWQTGTGRVVQFKHAGATPPAGIANDPLLIDEGWLDATDYYLPEPGVFDVLLRFSDGNFLRVTSEGMQFWYAANGRLERIYHRYEQNQHVLHYNERDELVRVDDESVTDDRFVRLGYFRFPTDPSFDADVDRETDNAFVAGKVAKLLDSAGRDVLFNYNDDGQLVDREGFLIDDGDGGPPRPVLRYVSEGECSGDLRGVTGAESGGASTFVADLEDAGTQPSAESGSGDAGSFALTPPSENQASSMAGASSTATRPDGTTVEIGFDELGQASEVRVVGANGESVSVPEYDKLGRLERVEFPEGNAIEYTYDAAGSVPLRSLPNPRTVKRIAGSRGGNDLDETLLYDGRYNLRSGANLDVDGNTVTYQLTGDHKDVESIDYGGDGTQSYSFNEYGQLLGSTSPEGIVRAIGYDTNSGYKTFDRLGGDQTDFGYDGSIGGLLGMPTTITPQDGATPSSVQYDARLLAVEVDRGGRVERRRYDALGNPVRIERETGEGLLVERRDYDEVGFLEAVHVEQVETGSGSATSTTTFVPDAERRVKEIHYPHGAVKTFTYDHQGKVVGMSYGGYTAEYTLDRHGNVTEIKEGGETTQTFTYDGHDRLFQTKRKLDAGDAIHDYTRFDSGGIASLTVTDPSFGVVQEYEILDIDALGRPRTVERRGDAGNDSVTYGYASTGSGGSVTATGTFETTTSTYDAAGRLLTASDGSRTVTWSRDSNGKVEDIFSSEDGQTYQIGFDYDGLDNLTLLEDALGTIETYTPRLDGHPIEIKDANDGVRTQSFSKLGELLGRTLPNGLGGVQRRYDDSRRRTAVLDLSGVGETYGYDPDFPQALQSITRRDGQSATIGGRDARGYATSATLPGGSVTTSYDLHGRVLTSTTTADDGPGFATEYEVDALGRARVARYGAGAADNSSTYSYDKLGPLRSMSVSEGGESYAVGYDIRSDGVRTGIDYPSGVSVTEGRDAGGRLVSVDDGGLLWSALTWFGRELPGNATLGSAITERRLYDPRGRLEAVRYERNGASVPLADVRYVYDANDNPIVRQQVHRGGRADFYAYDAADRITRADFGARPGAGSEEPRAFAGFAPPVGGFAPGRYARVYGYDGGGLDVMTGGVPENPDGVDLPPFAQVVGQHDGLLHPGLVDGQPRGTDGFGNTANARLFVREAGAPAPVARDAAIVHDGASHLVRVERADDVVVEYDYRHDGLFHRRRVIRAGDVVSERAYRWDGPRLLEEHELVDGVGLVARYFYREADAPFAADLRVGGTLQRFFYLRDAQSSVVAVADDAGNVRERIDYDAFGQPSIERGDVAAPRIARIVATADGMRVEFSEPVLPPIDTSPGNQLAGGSELGAVFELTRAGAAVPVEVSLEESAPNAPFGTVLRVRFPHVAATSLSLRLLAGSLTDESGNAVAEDTADFTDLTTPDATLFTEAPAPQTAPVRLARSELGSPFLFHGQWFDYDTGLLFLRARFLDVSAGVFLELDPAGYGPGTNLYAGIGNNPIGKRDPTGAWPFKSLPFIDDMLEAAGDAGTTIVKNVSGVGSVADDGAEVARAGGYLQEARSEAARLSHQFDDTQLDVEAIFNTIDDTPRTLDSGFQPRTMSEGDFDTGFDLSRTETGTGGGSATQTASGVGESTVDNTVLTASDIPSTRSADPPTLLDDTVEDLDLYVDPVENVGAAAKAPPAGGDYVSLYHGSIDNGPAIRKSGFRTHNRYGDPDTLFVSRDRVAAENALEHHSQAIPGQPGEIIESRVPRDIFEAYFPPELERRYQGYMNRQGQYVIESTEIRARTPQLIEIINLFMVR